MKTGYALTITGPNMARVQRDATTVYCGHFCGPDQALWDEAVREAGITAADIRRAEERAIQCGAITARI